MATGKEAMADFWMKQQKLLYDCTIDLGMISDYNWWVPGEIDKYENPWKAFWSLLAENTVPPGFVMWFISWWLKVFLHWGIGLMKPWFWGKFYPTATSVSDQWSTWLTKKRNFGLISFQTLKLKKGKLSHLLYRLVFGHQIM